jgi:hypothetical protein
MFFWGKIKFYWIKKQKQKQNYKEKEQRGKPFSEKYFSPKKIFGV